MAMPKDPPRSFCSASKDTRMEIDVEMGHSQFVGPLNVECPKISRPLVKSGKLESWTFTLTLLEDEVLELALAISVIESNELVKYKSLEIENVLIPGTMVYNRRLPVLDSRSVMLVVAHIDRACVEGEDGSINLKVNLTKMPIILLGPPSPGYSFHALPKKPNAPRSIFTEPMFCLAEKLYRDAGRTGNHLFKLTSTQPGDIHHHADVAGHRAILNTRPVLAQLIHENGFRRLGAVRGPFYQGISSLTVGVEHFGADRKIFQEVVRYIYCRQRPEHLLFDIAIEGRPYGCWSSLFRILQQLGVQDLFELSLSIWKTYLTQESALQNYRLWAYRYPAVVETLAQFVVAHASEPYEGHKMMTYMTYVADRCSDVDFLPKEPHKTLMMHIAALKSTKGRPALEF
ncbi:hypothetical protein BGW41_001104 [Actinomortierella wolfii]|nr:hypothetical protein BGW41_001104 [Actinomortierella wolfii]